MKIQGSSEERMFVWCVEWSKTRPTGYNGCGLKGAFWDPTLPYAMDPCFLLDHEIIVDPKMKPYPKVLFGSIGIPS